jgi:hypothetical protein
MATVRVQIVILTVRTTLSVCPFNRMAHTANTTLSLLHPPGRRHLASFQSRSSRCHGFNYLGFCGVYHIDPSLLVPNTNAADIG